MAPLHLIFLMKRMFHRALSYMVFFGRDFIIKKVYYNWHHDSLQKSQKLPQESKQLHFDNLAFPKSNWPFKSFSILYSLKLRKKHFEKCLLLKTFLYLVATVFPNQIFFESRYFFNIPALHPACLSTCSVKTFAQYLCQYSLWQKQCYVLSETSPVLGIQK